MDEDFIKNTVHFLFTPAYVMIHSTILAVFLVHEAYFLTTPTLTCLLGRVVCFSTPPRTLLDFLIDACVSSLIILVIYFPILLIIKWIIKIIMFCTNYLNMLYYYNNDYLNMLHYYDCFTRPQIFRDVKASLVEIKHKMIAQFVSKDMMIKQVRL